MSAADSQEAASELWMAKEGNLELDLPRVKPGVKSKVPTVTFSLGKTLTQRYSDELCQRNLVIKQVCLL